MWTRGVDSYSPLEIGYVQSDTFIENTQKRTKDTSKVAENIKTL
jgi:hypothetical protein